MANDLMTLEQVCEMLGRTPGQVQALVADGRLTQMGEGTSAVFNRFEVEQIAAKEGSSIVDLSAEDLSGSGSFPSALSDLAEASSPLSLLDASPTLEEPAAAPPPAELRLEEIPLDLPAASPQDPATSMPIMLDDSVSDMGLSGSSIISLEPDLEQERPAAPPAPAAAQPFELDAGVPDLGLSGSSIINLDTGLEETRAPAAPPAAPKKKGISVFDEEEGIEVDPMGETQIAASVPELESVGSGSGLLDLTRESDDTSLGHELLDVISPSSGAAAEETETESAVVAMPVDEGEEGFAAAGSAAFATPTPAVAARAAVGAPGVVPMNISLVLGILALAVVGLSTAAAIQGVWPAFLNFVARGVGHYAVFGGVALVAIVTGILGIVSARK